MKLTDVIKELREEKGLTQEVLAQKAGLTRGYISRLESGDYTDGSPTIKTLQKIAEGLAIPLDYILSKAGITKEAYINDNNSFKLVLRARYDLSAEQITKVEHYIQSIKNNKNSK